MGAVYSKFLQVIGNEDWERFPWKGWKSPAKQFKVLPTFVVIEWTYRLAAWSCLVHAMKTNGVPLWFSAWLCGTANDIFFMFLPFCDNFWQAQASVMITPRLPLYIVEMYATIIYLSTTAARQFNLPFVSEATLTGLLAHVLYGVYDINGPPFLWWTWHDSDAAITQRQQNAPLGSSIWILTYIMLHSLLLRWTEYSYARLSGDLANFLRTVLTKLPTTARAVVDKLKLFTLLDLLKTLQTKLNGSSWAARIAFSGAVCTPLFMSLMGVLQIYSLDTIGIPGQRTYKLTLIAYTLITLRGFRKAYNSGALFLPKQKSTRKANKILLAVTSSFYAINLAISKSHVCSCQVYYERCLNFGILIALLGDSKKHVSTGVHQKFSKKSHLVKDVMGFKREDHLLPGGPHGYSKDDYDLLPPADNGKVDAAGDKLIAPKEKDLDAHWYSVVGKERKDKPGDVRLMLKFITLGMLGYGAAFSNVGTLPAYI